VEHRVSNLISSHIIIDGLVYKCYAIAVILDKKEKRKPPLMIFLWFTSQLAIVAR